MNFETITISGDQFEKHYLIYFVFVKNKRNTYFYIGQTGDRHYMTARPAFRRLAGHLGDQGWATDNQVYRQIAVKALGLDASERRSFSGEIKDKVSNYLSESEIEMCYFKVKQFSSSSNREQHKKNVLEIEKLEKNLIFEFANDSKLGEFILNLKVPSKLSNESEDEKLKRKKISSMMREKFKIS